jgi:hypothetical protein
MATRGMGRNPLYFLNCPDFGTLRGVHSLWNGMSGSTMAITMRHGTVLRLATLWMCIMATGCGKSGIERASIHGTVTLDGQPAGPGTIRLVSIEDAGGPSSGGEIVDGQYSIGEAKGPTLGRHRVEVYLPYNTGRRIPSPMGGPVPVTEVDPNVSQANQSTMSPNQAGMVEAWSDRAPLKYNRESILEVIIESGSNEFDIQMESK